MSNGELVVQDKAMPALSEAGAFVQMLERASRDPLVDVDKLERLMAIHERMLKTQAESAFNDALVACQRECGTIAADATNPQTRSKYATYAGLDKRLRPIYTKHGISISYGTEDTPKAETVRVIAHVAKGGYSRIYRVDMPADGKGAKGGDVMTKTHATGAAISYGSRYLLKAIFNISIGEEDDDGNLSGKGMPTDTLKSLLETVELIETPEDWDKHWAAILEAGQAHGDINAHETLRAAMVARKRAMTAKGPK